MHFFKKLCYAFMLMLIQPITLQATTQRIPKHYAVVPGESCIPFDRESMNYWEANAHYGVEGYWSHRLDLYPFPQKHETSWPGKTEFLRRLYAIESSAQDGLKTDADRATIIKYGYRGFSYSRIDGSAVGSCEFCDTQEKIIWPEGYSTHYIEKYNVVPSREFYRYVMNYSFD